MLHDLSQRMRLDGELRASEARWRRSSTPPWTASSSSTRTAASRSFNSAAERLFRRGTRAASAQRQCPDAVAVSRKSTTPTSWYLATGTEDYRDRSRSHRPAQGRQRVSAAPVRGKMTVDGATKFTGILHDLSARVRIEAQLREQASLARIGEMAAVIAHEVKNPLAGIRGAIQVIGARLPKDSKDVVMVKEIVSRIDALNDLMKDLLLFARPPQPKPSPVDVATLVAATADLLGGDPALKDVRVSVAGAAPTIMADPELLKIVFVNLLVNSAHAMQERNDSRVARGSRRHVSDYRRRPRPRHPGRRPRQDLRPVLHDEARGTGLACRPRSDRGPSGRSASRVPPPVAPW